ncbi:hypothetical protein NEHOM01_1754 [Nematocida homosporus]|uniref:uncharacterized protein n=1 Tax=Nematocida homosporus TaxID=1912981 RepID=UPI00221F27C8|nr:uncharacterized protein NEHOM01_1754 [Nematocida homosporus]KAI5186859.1 hypothetical protein NEHOM01_1754 [Nematocida homosporus]
MQIHLLFLLVLIQALVVLGATETPEPSDPSSNSVSLTDYNWVLAAPNETFDSTKASNLSAETINNVLQRATKICITEKSVLKKLAPPRLPDLLKSRVYFITHVSFTGISTITAEIFTDLAQFINLEEIRIVALQPSDFILTSTFNCLKACTKLHTLHLHMPEVAFPDQRIEVANSNLHYFEFTNHHFQDEIIILNGPNLTTIKISASRLQYIDVLKPTKKDMSFRLIAPSMEYLPECILYKDNLYLDIRLDRPSPTTNFKEHTVFAPNRIRAGTDVLLSRIVSLNILQKQKPFMCCPGTKFTSWTQYEKHRQHSHPTVNSSLAIAETINNTLFTMALPTLPPSDKNPSYALSSTEITDIVDFLNRVTITDIKINIGKYGFNMSSKNPDDLPRQVSEWTPILLSLSHIAIENTNTKIDLPVCFYKLYTLRSIKIINCNFPNLLDLIIAMPGLRTVYIESSTFHHANTKIFADYRNKLKRYCKDSKTFKILNCQSEESLNFLFNCFIIGMGFLFAIMTLLYVISLNIRKKELAKL